MPEAETARKGIGCRGALLIALSIAGLLFWSLTICDPFGPQRAVSDSIEDSKEIGAFVAEYLPLENPYRFGESIRFTVREAWLERSWWHSSKLFAKPEIDDYSGYQLVMVIDKEELRNYTLGWAIGTYTTGGLFTPSYRGLYISMAQEPEADRLEWMVQEGNIFSDSAGPKVVGHFVLQRKR